MLDGKTWQQAIDVQDASNLSGVVFAFARTMQKLCDEGIDTDARNSHPISILFASKILSLANPGDDMLRFSHAYDECESEGRK